MNATSGCSLVAICASATSHSVRQNVSGQPCFLSCCLVIKDVDLVSAAHRAAAAAAAVVVCPDVESAPVKWAYGVEGNATFLECEAAWPQAHIQWTLQRDGAVHTTVTITLFTAIIDSLFSLFTYLFTYLCNFSAVLNMWISSSFIFSYTTVEFKWLQRQLDRRFSTGGMQPQTWVTELF